MLADKIYAALLFGIYLTRSPLRLLITFITVRSCYDVYSCWTRNAGAYQWIIYIPNLACLVVSFCSTNKQADMSPLLVSTTMRPSAPTALRLVRDPHAAGEHLREISVICWSLLAFGVRRLWPLTYWAQADTPVAPVVGNVRTNFGFLRFFEF